MRGRHFEGHRVGRVGWLRASVLGANDGLLSTASLIIGVASGPTDHSAIVIVGVAGMIAGSMAMAAGEYVSVSSQHDAEQADLARESGELIKDGEAEERELTRTYRARAGPGTRGRIEKAFRRSANLEAKGVRVSAEDGRVKLEGKVATWSDRQAVERAAWAAPGVRSVEDLLLVV